MPNGTALLLVYAAAGFVKEPEFRGIRLGQRVAPLRGATGPVVAELVGLVGPRRCLR